MYNHYSTKTRPRLNKKCSNYKTNYKLPCPPKLTPKRRVLFNPQANDDEELKMDPRWTWQISQRDQQRKKGKASRNMNIILYQDIAKGSTHNNHKMSRSSKVGSQSSVPFQRKFQVVDK